MGSSMLRLWIERGIISHAHIIKPSTLSEPFASYPNISYSATYDKKEPITSDIFMIAVKPQMLDKAMSPIAQYIPSECCVLSIAAGKEISTLSNYFSGKQPIVRIMPNTPSAIGKGVSAAIANEAISPKQREDVNTLLRVLGPLYWIDDEPLMNAIAALSGSGPAYVFYMIEVLSKAGRSIGIPEDISNALARQTVIGSAALAERDCDISTSTLRENVTSPGGSTLEALKILMDGRLESLFCDALYAAKKRGEELN
jgi:pyrroline-5-carboxylate reductase